MNAERFAGQTWAFRREVEDEAALRFAQLAAKIAEFDPGSSLIELALQAADDERRHSVLCAQLAEHFETPLGPPSTALPPLAPRSWTGRDALLYEMVAQCCVAESESTATLLMLLESRPIAPVREVLRSLARDEVRHAQLGWTFVAHEASRRNVGFLSGVVKNMVSGTAGSLFEQHVADEVSGEFGVLTTEQKQAVFLSTMYEVVLPGLEQFGIDTEPTRVWLKSQTAE